MKIMFCGVIVIIMVLLSGCGLEKTKTTKQIDTQSNTTQNIRTSNNNSSQIQS